MIFHPEKALAGPTSPPENPFPARTQDEDNLNNQIFFSPLKQKKEEIKMAEP